MPKTNEELDVLIDGQEDRLAEDAGMVDVRRGNVSKSYGQLAGNRVRVIDALESRKALATVNLKAGI